MTVSSSSKYWLVCQSASILSIDWNNDRILYHALSKETHFLNATAACIIDYLNKSELIGSPVCLDDLLNHLNQEMKHISQENLGALILTLMKRLESLGIVVAVKFDSKHES